MLKFKKIIIVSNITDLSGPTEGLSEFLQKKTKILLTIYHPFFYCRIKKSQAKLYFKGKLIKEKNSRAYSLPEYLKYFVDQILTLYYFLIFRKTFDLYIGVNCLHALVGIFFRKLGLVEKVVFYTIDWMPWRFKNPLMNWLYYKVDKYSRTNADYVWNLSEKITQLRTNQGVPKNKNLYVPNGVNFEEIKKIKRNKIYRKSLVLLGALYPDKGVDLIIKTIPSLWRKFSQLKLIIIGSTPKVAGVKSYEKIFTKMGSRVQVLGTLPHQKILKLLPHYGIGLAPYQPQKNSISYFSWPARVIDYLACGLPVIITPVPAIAKTISLQKAGVLINYTKKDLIKAITKLLTNDRFYWQARKNARWVVKYLSWNNVFNHAFKQMNAYERKRSN